MIYRFDEISIEMSMAFFTEADKTIPKHIRNHKRLQIAKTLLRKKNKAGGLTLPDFKICYKTVVIKEKQTKKL